MQQVRVGKASDGVVHNEHHSIASREGGELMEVRTRQQGIAGELCEDRYDSVHHRVRGRRRRRRGSKRPSCSCSCRLDNETRHQYRLELYKVVPVSTTQEQNSAGIQL